MIRLANKIYESIKQTIKDNFKLILSVIFIIFIFNFELPYAIEKPGGYISLNDRISVTDGYETSGDIGMAYVTMVKGSIPFLLYSKLNSNWDIVKKSDITYDNETMKEMNERERLSMKEALSNATINAYKMANKSYEVTETNVYITYLNSNDTELKMLDQILAINDTSVTKLEDIKVIVEASSIDDYLNVKIKRDNKEMTVKTKVFDLEGQKKIGVGVTLDKKITTDPEVKIKVKSNESGPSGGLMMSLAIYNNLIPEDITKGLKIIGTGTIDEDGNVGEIGGIKYKLAGAVKKKAKVFLCPKENLDEAQELVKSNKYDIKIIGVATFKEALEELSKL